MRPRLLDLYAGAGGSAVGYARAGFDVVGVDIKPQPNYPFEFVQADALEFLTWDLERDNYEPPWFGFDAIHASPPCQRYSLLTQGLGTPDSHPDLVGPTRDLLDQTGLPYVIENVVGAPLRHPFKLCGSSFGLRVWRHRLFETNWPIGMLSPCSHSEHELPLDVTGTGGPGGRHRKPASVAEAREAMGISWMTRAELSEAIPPAYCEFIGTQLLSWLRRGGDERGGSSPSRTPDIFASPDPKTRSLLHRDDLEGSASSGRSHLSAFEATSASSRPQEQARDALD